MFRRRETTSSTHSSRTPHVTDPHEKLAAKASKDREKAIKTEKAIHISIAELLGDLHSIIGEEDHHKDKSPDNEKSWRDITTTPGLVINAERVVGSEIYTGSISTPIGGVTDYRVEAGYVEFAGVICEEVDSVKNWVRFETQCVPAELSHRSKESADEFFVNMGRLKKLVEFYKEYKALQVSEVGGEAVRLAS